MALLPPPSQLLLFEDIVLDTARRTLRKAGEERRLRARSFDVLVYLARHTGRVVGKQELFEQVWNGVAVTDDSLVQCLIDIRRALADRSAVIRTVRGHGYMLDAVVSAGGDVHGAEPPSAGTETSARAVGPARDAPARRVSPRQVGVALVLLAAAGVLAQLARGRLGATGEPRVAPQATLQPRVEQLMIEGGRVFKTRTQAGLQRARQAYQAAVDLDPGHAPAHAALSFTLSVLHAFGVEAPHNVLPPAGVHARRALELDPTLAMGWHALAHYQVHWTREWALAEANYRRAIALDPSDVNPQFLLAHLLMGLQRPDEAVQQSLRALALDPDSAQLTTSSGIVHYFTRRVDEALRYLDRAQMLDPEYATAAFWKARTLAALDRPDAAMQQALRARRGMGNVPTWIVGYVHARAGRAREAHAVLEALEAYAGQHYVPPVELAYLHLALGDRARALARRAEGVDGRSRWIELMAVDPILDPLRDEPRFHALLARMGLPR